MLTFTERGLCLLYDNEYSVYKHTRRFKIFRRRVYMNNLLMYRAEGWIILSYLEIWTLILLAFLVSLCTVLFHVS
jgi:hypothetical protein